MCETGGKNDEVNHVKLKNAIPMGHERRHIIKFLHFKGLKLDDIVTELSDMYGRAGEKRSHNTTYRRETHPPRYQRCTFIDSSEISFFFNANNC
jgi:hypothetical protein